MTIYEVYDDDGRTYNFYLLKETAEDVKNELNASSEIFEYYVCEISVIED
jgi:hypothetical protein